MKNKIAIVAIIISLIAMSAYADALFENAYLSDLRVIKADEQAGWTLIQDRGGNEGDVVVGDSIGWEQAVVVAIEKAAIMVEREDLKTRMPVVDPFAGN
ncbi:MAG: hypothetical protein KQI81_24870 [Deltaproteobacteria bacterium]|nr:hypothetical protein [Deltaproteobacteria bacterium]